MSQGRSCLASVSRLGRNSTRAASRQPIERHWRPDPAAYRGEFAASARSGALSLVARALNLGTERCCGRGAADEPRRAHCEELHRGRDARGGRLRHKPGSEKVLGEFADLGPFLVTSELLLKPLSELITEGGLDVSPWEAAPGADHARGQRVDSSPQMCDAELNQLAFHFPSLGVLLSSSHLPPGVLDRTCEEGLHVAQGRRRAIRAEPAFQICRQPESDRCGRVSGKLSLGAYDQLSERMASVPDPSEWRPVIARAVGGVRSRQIAAAGLASMCTRFCAAARGRGA